MAESSERTEKGTQRGARRGPDHTVASVLTSRATSDPEGVFLLHDDEIVTFGQMESWAEALAASLAGLGIEAVVYTTASGAECRLRSAIVEDRNSAVQHVVAQFEEWARSAEPNCFRRG